MQNIKFIINKKNQNDLSKINNKNFNYNQPIKNIFSNTEQFLINKGRNTDTKKKKNINLIMNSLFTDFKKNNNRIKIIETDNK